MDFRAFEVVPGRHIMLLPDAPVYTIAAASSDFVLACGLRREELVGKSFFDFFQQDIDTVNGAGNQRIKASLDFVLQQKTPQVLPEQHLNISLNHGATFPRYQTIKHVPVLSVEGSVEYIIHSHIASTAASVLQKSEGRDGIEKAYQFFMRAPVIIGYLRGDDYIIELANEGLLEVWGRTSEVVGLPLLKAIPELESQGFIALLDNVRKTGEAFYAYEFPITLVRNGKEEVLYFDFVYEPFYESEGDAEASGIISVGHNVTAQVLAKKK